MTNGVLTNSLTQLLLTNEREAADRVYLRQPKNGIWHDLTWGEVMLQARKVAGFLQHLGLKRGSHVSIISKNCAEWFIVDFGICLAGMVNVPLFANQHAESIHYVLEHGDVQLVFVGKLDDYQRVRSYIPDQYKTIGFDYHPTMQVDYTWQQVLDYHVQVDVVEPDPDDLYTLIYSSGTSGTPKGAMYTHQAIANYLTVFPQDLLKIRDLPHYRLLSYLPLAHVYERSAVLLASVTMHCDVSFIESLDKFTQNMQEIQPHLFTAVPRIWGVFQQKIEHKLSPNLLNILLKIPLVSSFIKQKIKKELGLGACMNFISGASHLPVDILDFFDKLDIKIQEGYGQTENMAYATLSMLHEMRKGYVGSPRTMVEIKQGDENELWMTSPCLMQGYYKDTHSSKNAFTSEGWLRTGDIVEIDALDRVKIVSRVSEIFKNQSGEFIIPAPIEKRFLTNPMIEQLCLLGRGLQSNVLIVTLTEDARLLYSKEEIKSSLQQTLGKVNSELVKFEIVSHIIIAKDFWTTDNDLLTPTLKVKRRGVEQYYAELIKNAMKDRQSVIWE